MMKKLLFLTTLTLFFISRGFAQWTEIPIPAGPPITGHMEILNGKVYIAFSTSTRVKCMQTTDYIHWSTAADLPGGSLYGRAKVIPEGERLYLFVFNKNLQTANAWLSEDEGQNWSDLNLPLPTPYFLTPIGSDLLCASDFAVKHSADGGASWNTVLTVPEKIWDIKQTKNQSVLIATANNIYRSMNHGLSWDTLSPPYNTEGLVFPALTIFPTETAAFVTVDSASSSKLFRSLDDGVTWELILIPTLYDFSQVRDLLSVGNTMWGAFNSGIATSNDNGDTWVFHLTPHGADQLEAKGDTIFTGSSIGFFKTYDQADSWISGNLGWFESGIGNHSFLEFGKIYADQERLYLTSFRGLFSTDNDGVEWRLHSNYGSFTHHFYAGDTLLFIGQGLLRSFDGGVTWEYLNREDYPHPLYGQYNFAKVGNQLFAATLSRNKIYRSVNFGNDWQEMPALFSLPERITSSGNALYVEDSNGISVSSNNGQSFQPFESGLGNNPPIQGAWGTEDNIFAWSNGQLWRRVNNQWVPASAGLYDEMGSLPFILDINGEAGNTLLVGQSYVAPHPAKLFLSHDGGISWGENLAEGLPIIEADFLALVRNGNIYAKMDFIDDTRTEIWKRSVVVETNETNRTQALHLFPNPAGELASIRFTGQTPFRGILMLHDFTGRLIWQQEIAGETQVQILVKTLPAGIYSVSAYSDTGKLKQMKLVVAH